MELEVVYDNEVFKKGINLKSDWGFACLIRTKNENILFDTGAKGDILLNNMRILNIYPEEIKKVIISHEHNDHKGGLKKLITKLNDVEVYHLGSKDSIINNISVIPEIPEQITERIWTTGRLKGLVDEHSLVLEGKNGWYVLTGCSHPGIDKILQVSNGIGNIVGIIGGFHGFNNFKLVENLDFICPCHCTAHKKELMLAYPDKTSNCGVGKKIDLG